MARRLNVVSSASLSVAAHVIALLIVAIALANKPSTTSDGAPAPYTRLAYTPAGGRRGPSDGGPGPPARVRRPESVVRDARQLSQPIAISQPAVLAGLDDAIGAVTELRPVDFSSRGGPVGPGGDGRKAGTGEGGEGGTGNRPGPGTEGDGVEPGNGVSWPRLLREVKPNYTAEAVRARLEGKVELEIVVLPDGTVGRVRVVRSLDPLFGLDQAAIDAVRRWRFEPGRQFGKAVPVRVGVELSFILR